LTVVLPVSLIAADCGLLAGRAGGLTAEALASGPRTLREALGAQLHCFQFLTPAPASQSTSHPRIARRRRRHQHPSTGIGRTINRTITTITARMGDEKYDVGEAVFAVSDVCEHQLIPSTAPAVLLPLGVVGVRRPVGRWFARVA
jgi:hypothetical protein